MIAERWLPVAGYEGHYEVSDAGRVRSTKRDIYKILKPHKIGWGYLSVLLSKPGTNHNRKRTTVHKLVLETFVGKRPPGMEARHYPDNTPSNCSLSNLSWCTPKKNWEDRDAAGHHYRGEACKIAKLTELAVRAIYHRYHNGETSENLAQEYKVNPATIRRIARRATWQHLDFQSNARAAITKATSP